MNGIRLAMFALGGLAMAYGAWLLLSRQSISQVIEVAVWLAVAVIIHDALIAGVALALGWFGGRYLPADAARGAVVTFVLLGPALLISIPYVGRFGARPDNPTLLDRDYTLGLIAVVVVCVLAGFAVAVGSRRRKDP